MKIYTSWYKGEQIGESISISLYPPKDFDGKHLPLLAPSDTLFRQWKASKKDEAAQQEYTKTFLAEIEAKSQLIDVWLNKLSGDVTLNCYEEYPQFCHRHLLKDLLESKRPGIWGGEVTEVLRVNKSEARSQDESETSPMTEPPTQSWEEWLFDGYGIKLYDPNPNPPTPKPWHININSYALHGGEIVKIVGGDKSGKWQLERSPQVNPTQHLLNEKQWVKTKDLTQPPPGHETWTDADFAKTRKKSKAVA